jgi:hypothetical protein
MTPAQHQRRSESLSLLPKFFQPKSTASRMLTTTIYHWDILSKFATDEADAQTMWAWVEAALVYSEMTRLLIKDGLPVSDEAVQAINEQLGIVAQVIDRFAATGRVELTTSQYEIARQAGYVMDQLIAAERHGIFHAAYKWSQTEINKMKVVTA